MEAWTQGDGKEGGEEHVRSHHTYLCPVVQWLPNKRTDHQLHEIASTYAPKRKKEKEKKIEKKHNVPMRLEEKILAQITESICLGLSSTVAP